MEALILEDKTNQQLLNEAMVSIPLESSSNPSNPIPNSTPPFTIDLDIHIAICKGVKCCIKHLS